nr:hypothetical protein [Tanacetum cinerariifolium]
MVGLMFHFGDFCSTLYSSKKVDKLRNLENCFQFKYISADKEVCAIAVPSIVIFKEITIPLNEIDSQIPPFIAITPILPTVELEDSLIIGDEDLSTIPKKESDKFIKSSIEDLVPILKDIESTTSYDSNLDESALLVTPIFVSNEDECFDLGDNIELLLHRDPSTPKISVASILDEFTNEPPLEENDDLFDLESKNNE